MTLWASEVHENDPVHLRIHSNHGNVVTITDTDFGRQTRVEVVITDELPAMKSLWNSLGVLIAKKEKQLAERVQPQDA